jgi:Skp family chaperone for outer membrane proteins
MISRSSWFTLACSLLMAGCASTSSPDAAPASAAEDKKKPVWTVPTEQETAAALDKKFEDAAKGYVKLKKDGVLLFCKRTKELGSNLPSIKCITEAQLRNQVETMDDYRERRRNAAKCTHGVGCGAGF